ncbi:SDR family oxidoreductase [Rhizosaccharibacter radicis]|uniref:SDR family oxidoreductase n=1 Tax=Rhizosaccharibacter radicis TaxID=2782605 RepID=A0ABT1VZT3_9PROT|nr:SDR family oxidoreductase [Acetobacteraceae bacterium KSS12]
MRIFLTGATGFIGSRLVPELLAGGHEVVGVTRSPDGAERLAAAGAEAWHGTLEDPDGLRTGASRADAVIHTAFDHDFSRFAENCEKDRRVIEALGSALEGSRRPLLVTSGVGLGLHAPGELAREDVFDDTHPTPRIASEQAANALLARGVNVSVVRLPQVHDTVKQGLITPLVAIARANNFVGVAGEGRNRFAAAHVDDVARLYRLALERAEPGARYNAVAEEGVEAREIARVIGAGLGMEVRHLPADEAASYFGWMARIMAMDLAASSEWTRRVLNWHPTGPTLLADLESMDYAASSAA